MTSSKREQGRPKTKMEHQLLTKEDLKLIVKEVLNEYPKQNILQIEGVRLESYDSLDKMTQTALKLLSETPVKEYLDVIKAKKIAGNSESYIE